MFQFSVRNSHSVWRRKLTLCLGSSYFPFMQDFAKKCICYAAQCKRSFLESLELNDAFLKTLNTNFSPQILRTRLQLSIHCFGNEPNRKRCTKWSFLRDPSRRSFRQLPEVFFASRRCFSSLNHDKRKLPIRGITLRLV